MLEMHLRFAFQLLLASILAVTCHTEAVLQNPITIHSNYVQCIHKPCMVPADAIPYH